MAHMVAEPDALPSLMGGRVSSKKGFKTTTGFLGRLRKDDQFHLKPIANMDDIVVRVVVAIVVVVVFCL